MPEASKERHEPFSSEALTQDPADFQPKAPHQVGQRPDLDALRAIAAASGFEERSLAAPRHLKEPLKALQFRLPQSQVEWFRQLAYEAFGPTHGAKTALFLKMWEAYLKGPERQDDEPAS